MDDAPPNLPAPDETRMEIVQPSGAWLMTSAAMLAFATSPPFYVAHTAAAFRDEVIKSHWSRLDPARESARRWKREHWTEAMFLNVGDQAIMADLAALVETDYESELSLQLLQIREDAAMYRERGFDVPGQHKNLYEGIQKQLNKKSPDGQPIIKSRDKTIVDAVTELGLPFHLIGMKTQVVRPLTCLARNLPLLPNVIGRAGQPVLLALPAAAVQMPPLRLGARGHIEAVLNDVIIGAPFKIASLVRTVMSSMYIRASATTTHPVTLRLYMNQNWPRPGHAEDLPIDAIDGSNEFVRNIAIHIPAQVVGTLQAVVFIYIDSGDYMGRWNVEELDRFELDVLLPNMRLRDYFGASRDSEWRIVSRWRAYVSEQAYEPIMKALASDLRTLLKRTSTFYDPNKGTVTQVTSRKLYAVDGIDENRLLNQDAAPAFQGQVDLKQAYAYRAVPQQLGASCTPYALTMGAYLMNLERPPNAPLTVDLLETKGLYIREQAGALYTLLRYGQEEYTTMPIGGYTVPKTLPALAPREVPALIASVYPYIGYYAGREFIRGKTGDVLWLAGMSDWVKNMRVYPGRLKHLITATCASPYLRRYTYDASSQRPVAIDEPSFIIGFTRNGHTIMVHVAPARRLARTAFQIDVDSIPTMPERHRFFYFDSIKYSPDEARGPVAKREDTALLLSFKTVDELDAYFTLHNKADVMDMIMYVHNKEIVQEAYQTAFEEIARHGFLPPHGEEPETLAPLSLANSILASDAHVFEGDQTSRAGPTLALTEELAEKIDVTYF